MTRAVLGDAIALIRGDRYYTTDFSREFSVVYFSGKTSYVLVTTAAANLTTWGYQDTQRDPNNGGFGGESKNNDVILTLASSLTLSSCTAVPKLLMRHLPRHYPFVSHYYCDCCPSHTF